MEAARKLFEAILFLPYFPSFKNEKRAWRSGAGRLRVRTPSGAARRRRIGYLPISRNGRHVFSFRA
jgi:hypothetical protein